VPDDADDLRARVARLEAGAEIAQLPARYARAYATMDGPALGELYAHDTATESQGRGREAIAQRLADTGHGPAGLRTTILHPGGHVIEVDADDPTTASGHVHSRAEVERGDGTWYYQAIHYGDRYVFEEGRWRFHGVRDHELFYGVEHGGAPNRLPDAHWPERSVGRGSVPHRWSSWHAWTDGLPHREQTQPKEQ